MTEVHALVKDIMTAGVAAVRSDAPYREMTTLLRARRPDQEIRREITEDVILDGFFTDPARFTVTVKDGIVTMQGEPGSIVLGRNIVDQARHVEGVVAVRDRFTYPPATEAS